MSPEIVLSFEFFPPSTIVGRRRLLASFLELADLAPRFVSVTCGAGGSARGRTRETVDWLRAQSHIPCAPHVVGVGQTREQVDHLLRDYLETGVSHVVALRGDPPGGLGTFVAHSGGYRYAAELVASARSMGLAEISVAAYPEVHPEATSAAADLDNLKRKVDAGASRAITQFFFDPDVYLRFVERARAAGIEVPIVAGILPVWSLSRVRDFATRCAARIPAAMARRFHGLEEGSEAFLETAQAFGAELCGRLRDAGVRDFHFYSMNRSDLPIAICRRAGLRGASGSRPRQT